MMVRPKVIYHPDVLAEDFPRLNSEFPGRGLQLLAQIQKAVREIVVGESVPTKDMEPPYKGWHRKKFFSTPSPPVGMRPDLRIIFQLSGDRSELRILAIGKRMLGSPNDIYTTQAARNQDF